LKLPALSIAAAFSLGIVVGLLPAFSNRATSPVLLGLLFGLACTSLLTGIVLVHFRRLAIAGAASLLCWIALGWRAFALINNYGVPITFCNWQTTAEST
jgi:hypothetical protein